MSIKKSIIILTALIVCTMMVAAQNPTQSQPEKTIKHVPVKATSPTSGKEMYDNYCAVCHGTDGKGAGPAATALKTPATNLTTLSRLNGGKYPSLQVEAAIRGEVDVPAHGSKDMPVWGSLFWNMSAGHETEVLQRIANLTKYIETLQAQ